jgi:hypothetical protein
MVDGAAVPPEEMRYQISVESVTLAQADVKHAVAQEPPF